jgi:hypothetical protein
VKIITDIVEMFFMQLIISQRMKLIKKSEKRINKLRCKFNAEVSYREWLLKDARAMMEKIKKFELKSGRKDDE